MKKKVFLMALVGVALTACSNHDDVFTGKTQQEAQYEQNFVKKFGQPDPNHTWGFGNTTKSTRAAWTGQEDGNIGVNNGNNLWYKSMSLPAQITKEEQKKVYDVFSKTKVTNVSNPNWQRFFVQQVWKGTAKYTTSMNREIIGSNQMDKLLCGKSSESMGHINNGNNGKISKTDVYCLDENGKEIVRKTGGDNLDEDGIVLVTNGGTACFGYKNSYDDNKNYDNYLLLEIDGAYYVGFDYELNKTDGEKLAADGIYTDWIVKIVPADYHKAPEGGEAWRVFCEDLGATDDFDFNDIVFDVVNTDGKTIITLRAAGGTLPAYIFAGNEPLGEVHELFGVPTKTMVNTRTNGAVERPIVVLEIAGSYSADKIRIVVEGKDGVQYPLEAKKGNVPYKFAAPLSVEWADERQDIKNRYERFGEWVKDQNNKFWE